MEKGKKKMRDYYELKRWGYPNSYPPIKAHKAIKPIKPVECIVGSVAGSAILTAFIWYMTTIPW